jgi:hypothetical protein
MRQLRLVGLAEEGDSLLLESPTGESYRLPLDERVRAACRGDLTRLGQIEIESDNPLRPREIQARVRAGESAEQVAASAGMALDRVLRFAYPVLQERSRVVAQARTAPVRPRASEQLGDLVEERLVGRGTDGGHAGVGRLAPGGRAVGGPAELAARGQRARRALEPRPRPARAAAGGPGGGAAERRGVPRADDHGGHPAGRGRASGSRADRPAGGGPAAAARGGPTAGGAARADRRRGARQRGADGRPGARHRGQAGATGRRAGRRERRRGAARAGRRPSAAPVSGAARTAPSAGTPRDGGRGRPGTPRRTPIGGRIADRGRRRDRPAGRRPG